MLKFSVVYQVLDRYHWHDVSVNSTEVQKRSAFLDNSASLYKIMCRFEIKLACQNQLLCLSTNEISDSVIGSFRLRPGMTDELLELSVCFDLLPTYLRQELLLGALLPRGSG